jgi:NTE family protein
MIGALSALSDSLDWDPRDAEVIVGTSAGSVLAAMLGCGLSVETLVNHQRGILAPGDPAIEFDYDSDAGGSLPPRPQLRIGSRALVAKSVLHPRRTPLMAGLAALAPRGRASLTAVGALINAVNVAGGWPTKPATWMVAMDYETGRRVPFGHASAPPATMAEAVMASCSIPGWYQPLWINGRSYIDGGTLSPTSIDLVADADLDEVYVLAPMVSFEYDEPTSVVGRLERRFRRLMTKKALIEAGKVRGHGTNVRVLGPGRDDLEAIGVNLMDSRRRAVVFETALRTSAATLAGDEPPISAAG